MITFRWAELFFFSCFAQPKIKVFFRQRSRLHCCSVSSISFCFSLSIQDSFYSLGNILSLWSCSFFQTYCIRHWYICSSHPNNRSIEVVECWAFNNLSANFGSNSVLGKASCKNESNKIKSRYIYLSIKSIISSGMSLAMDFLNRWTDVFILPWLAWGAAFPSTELEPKFALK